MRRGIFFFRPALAQENECEYGKEVFQNSQEGNFIGAMYENERIRLINNLVNAGEKLFPESLCCLSNAAVLQQ